MNESDRIYELEIRVKHLENRVTDLKGCVENAQNLAEYSFELTFDYEEKLRAMKNKLAEHKASVSSQSPVEDTASHAKSKEMDPNRQKQKKERLVGLLCMVADSIRNKSCLVRFLCVSDEGQKELRAFCDFFGFDWDEDHKTIVINNIPSERL